MIIIWLLSCILVGIISQRGGFLFIQGFVLSILLTPPLAFFAVYLSAEKKEVI
jgi:hypothetical protein